MLWTWDNYLHLGCNLWEEFHLQSFYSHPVLILDHVTAPLGCNFSCLCIAVCTNILIAYFLEDIYPPLPFHMKPCTHMTLYMYMYNITLHIHIIIVCENSNSIIWTHCIFMYIHLHNICIVCVLGCSGQIVVQSCQYNEDTMLYTVNHIVCVMAYIQPLSFAVCSWIWQRKESTTIAVCHWYMSTPNRWFFWTHG